MTKVGRNHPCPCGSGKKYKQCCLDADEAARVAALPAQSTVRPVAKPSLANFSNYADVDPLDRLSNGTVDLIDAGQFDEAERMCQQLLTEFPEFPDGHMRLAHLHRRRGDNLKAAAHLRLAAQMARSDDNIDLADSLDAEAVEIDPPPT
jgi:tetratricopeptide (TPR) repeat protein